MVVEFEFPDFQEALDRQERQIRDTEAKEAANQAEAQAARDRQMKAWYSRLSEELDPIVDPILQRFMASLGQATLGDQSWTSGYKRWEAIHSSGAVFRVTVMASYDNDRVWPAYRLFRLRRKTAPILLVEVERTSPKEVIAYLAHASLLGLELSQKLQRTVVMAVPADADDQYAQLLQASPWSSQVRLRRMGRRRRSGEVYAIFNQQFAG